MPQVSQRPGGMGLFQQGHSEDAGTAEGQADRRNQEIGT